MPDRENAAVVLVAGDKQFINNLRDALAATNFALLHAQTKHEAIVLLEGLKSNIDLAIVELELPDFGGWDLIRQLTHLPNKPAKLIATTSTFPEPFFAKIKEIGVDAVVATTMPSEAWLRTVEQMLTKSQGATA